MNPKGLYCPECRGVRLSVVKVRRPCPGRTIRRRACVECGFRFNTEERVHARPAPSQPPPA